ncbi:MULTISPECIES: PH domain-containing protein [Bacillus]|uniref:PH domain-containing protein n=1 Tax=Bacillus TaxID=1386 RepID=UPI0023DFC448|nr:MULTISPECIES: PH domain-containing protein [Bacillus]MDF3255031.1 PH domain-containing protein [Bacillus velezensis]MDF3267740.1 PH domain-containing protein [Bacillus velezensis]
MEQLEAKLETMQKYHTAEELKASLPKGTTSMVKGCFKALANEQLTGEYFLGAFVGNVQGINIVGTKKDAGTTGIMAISNKRLIFIGKLLFNTKIESLTWSNFDSYSAQKGMLFGEITAMSRGGHKLRVTSIDKKVWQQGKKLLDELTM